MPALVLWGERSHVNRSYKPMEAWGERATRLAVKAASDLSLALFDNKLNAASAGLNTFLASHKVALKDVPPFTLDNVPAELGGGH